VRRDHHGKLVGLAGLLRLGRVLMHRLSALSCPPLRGGALGASSSDSREHVATRHWQMEGTAAEIAAQRQRIFGIASKFRGLDAGEENVSCGGVQ